MLRIGRKRYKNWRNEITLSIEDIKLKWNVLKKEIILIECSLDIQLSQFVHFVELIDHATKLTNVGR